MTEGSREIEFLYDVELELSVVLGNSQMLIRDLLQLKTGSVVELKKLAGESLDVVINDKVIARVARRGHRASERSHSVFIAIPFLLGRNIQDAARPVHVL